MKLWLVSLFAVTSIVSSSHAATLLIHYDVNDPLSWTGSQVKDLQNFSTNLIPGAGSPRTQSGPNTVPADFAAPVYQISGATSPIAAPYGMYPRSRAYLDFQKYGVLTGSNRDSAAFNTPTGADDGTNANLAGFTAEGFFIIRTDYSAAENGGLGIAHGGPGVGMIRINRGINSALNSNTSVDNSAGGPQSLENIDTSLAAIVPINQWFHFVKVHDVAADVVRIYINGSLQSTVALDPDSSAVEFHPGFTDQLGQVSYGGRELKNIGYSMTRFYRGALTADEVQANFIEVAFVPEPASLALMILGCLGVMGRNRTNP